MFTVGSSYSTEVSITSSQQRISLDHAVVEASERGARMLADAYWAEIRRLTLGTVRVRTELGGLELVFVGIVTLFRFGRPELVATPDRVECCFPITGGILAKRSGGTLSIAQHAGADPELVVTVEDYAPRLDSGPERGGVRTFAYRHLQRRAHAAIGRRYLARMTGGGR